MDDNRIAAAEELCPDCRGSGLYRPPGEWTQETCPTCDGRGVFARVAAAPKIRAGSDHTSGRSEAGTR